MQIALNAVKLYNINKAILPIYHLQLYQW